MENNDEASTGVMPISLRTSDPDPTECEQFTTHPNVRMLYLTVLPRVYTHARTHRYQCTVHHTSAVHLYSFHFSFFNLLHF